MVPNDPTPHSEKKGERRRILSDRTTWCAKSDAERPEGTLWQRYYSVELTRENARPFERDERTPEANSQSAHMEMRDHQRRKTGAIRNP